MEKLINSAFDFFAYALPGFCILVSFFIVDGDLNTSRDFLKLAGELKVGSGVVMLGLGYAVGFAVTPLGRMLYKWFYKRAFFRWLDRIMAGKLSINEKNEIVDPQGGKMFISDKFILVREFSPLNFKYIESWNVYSLMSHNMAVAGIVAFALIVYKIVVCQPAHQSFWIATLVVTAVLIVLFVYNAIKFNVWSANDQNSAIKVLKMKERAEKLDQQEPKKKAAKNIV
ncbi:MAG: hypothetical protein H6565_09870 [Lewinellaceae bacterium]|nr:hypothetical protein [Lewinellaceae bacterium]